MKLIKAGLLISVSCLAGVAQAGGDYLQGWGVAPQTKFYGGASLGAANQSDFDDGNTTAGKLYGGVRYGRYLGAEVGYTKLGGVEDKLDDRLETLFESDTSGIYAAAMGYLPVYYRTELMGKVGVMRWDTDSESNQTLIDNQISSSDSGTSPLIGIGAQYQLNNNMHVRGEWERVIGTGSDDAETDIDMLSVGVTLSTY
ncbi:MAG: outer membrane beta-barrel protein [Thiolinea sp.]